MRRLLFVLPLALGLEAGTVGFPLAASYTFETIDVPGGLGTQACGINDRGQIVGEYDATGEKHGFLLTEGTFTPIGVYFPGGHGFLATPIQVITVTMDIKPGEFPNSINPRSHGKIPVAMLTTDALDATTLNAATIRFGANG